MNIDCKATPASHVRCMAHFDCARAVHFTAASTLLSALSPSRARACVCKVIPKIPRATNCRGCNFLMCPRLSNNKTRAQGHSSASRTGDIQLHFPTHAQQRPTRTGHGHDLKSFTHPETSAGACSSPFSPLRSQGWGGMSRSVPRWWIPSLRTHTRAHTLTLTHSHASTRWLLREACGGISCWPEVSSPCLTPCLPDHTSGSAHSGLPRLRHTPSGWASAQLDAAVVAACEQQLHANSWKHTLTDRVCLTSTAQTHTRSHTHTDNNPNFYYSTGDASMGPKIRHVPAPCAMQPAIPEDAWPLQPHVAQGLIVHVEI